MHSMSVVIYFFNTRFSSEGGWYACVESRTCVHITHESTSIQRMYACNHTHMHNTCAFFYMLLKVARMLSYQSIAVHQDTQWIT